jgi:hypothetical protein
MAKLAISEQEPGTVILALLDNSVFYAKARDVSWLLPATDDKGDLHMPGEVRVEGRNTHSTTSVHSSRYLMSWSSARHCYSYCCPAMCKLAASQTWSILPTGILTTRTR